MCLAISDRAATSIPIGLHQSPLPCRLPKLLGCRPNSRETWLLSTPLRVPSDVPVLPKIALRCFKDVVELSFLQEFERHTTDAGLWRDEPFPRIQRIPAQLHDVTNAVDGHPTLELAKGIDVSVFSLAKADRDTPFAPVLKFGNGIPSCLSSEFSK